MSIIEYIETNTSNLKTIKERSKPEIFEKIKKIRGMTDFELVPSKFHLPDVVLRYYQIIGVYNMLCMSRLILGDDTGLGKTIESLSVIAYLKQSHPVCTPQ